VGLCIFVADSCNRERIFANTADVCYLPPSTYLHSAVSIVTRIRAGRSGVRIRKRQDIFPFRTSKQVLRPSQRYLFNSYRVSFRGVKRPVLESDDSLPFNAEVKNEWSYASTPALCLRGVDRDKSTFIRKFDCALCLRTSKFSLGRKFS
jgi:hypothetical protein